MNAVLAQQSTSSDADRLNHAAQVATRAGESISLNLTRVMEEIESFRTTVWKGAGGDAFSNVSNELRQELSNILQALNTMADNVNQTGKVFAATDDDIRQEILQAGQQYLPSRDTDVTNALRGVAR